MNQPSQKKREMFDKIRSSNERKQIFQQLIQENGVLICKGAGDSLFQFQPTELKDLDGLFGKITNVEGHFTFSQDIVVNFRVGEDRYFMHTGLINSGSREMIIIPEQLYKLQRRAHNRIELYDRIEQKIVIIEHNLKASFFDAKGLDISVGGARIQLQKSVCPLKQGDHLRMSFHIKNKWSFEISGEIKHLSIQGDLQTFGFEFDTKNKVLANKLTMIMLDLQHWVILNVID